MSIVRQVYDRTVFVQRALVESGREAVTKACLDTEAQAKRNITAMNAIDTGAARASIYSVTPEGSGYAAAAGEAQSEAGKGSRKLRRRRGGAKAKAIRVLPEHPVSRGARVAEGVTAVGVDYGAVINYGAAHMPARPFFTQAAEKVSAAFDKFCLRALRARLG